MGKKLHLGCDQRHFSEIALVTKTVAANFASCLKFITQKMQTTFADRALRGTGFKLDGAIIGAKSLFIIAQFRPAISYGTSRFAGRRQKFLRDLVPAQRAVRPSQNIKYHPEEHGYAVDLCPEFKSPHFLFQRLLELTFLVVNSGERTMSVRRVGVEVE